jgi:hypothetical protein
MCVTLIAGVHELVVVLARQQHVLRLEVFLHVGKLNLENTIQFVGIKLKFSLLYCEKLLLTFYQDPILRY